jgi:hypothetical protein
VINVELNVKTNITEFQKIMRLKYESIEIMDCDSTHSTLYTHTLLYCTVLYCTALHCTTLHFIVLYCNELY